MPLWVSLQAYGWDAYAQAVDHCFAIAAYAATPVVKRPCLELVLDPALTVLLVRRRGWRSAELRCLVGAGSGGGGLAFAIPTARAARPCCACAFVDPLTSRDDVDLVLDDLG